MNKKFFKPLCTLGVRHLSQSYQTVNHCLDVLLVPRSQEGVVFRQGLILEVMVESMMVSPLSPSASEMVRNRPEMKD